MSDLVNLFDIQANILHGMRVEIFGHRVISVDELFGYWEMKIEVPSPLHWEMKTPPPGDRHLVIRFDSRVYPDGDVPLDVIAGVFDKRFPRKEPSYRQVPGVIRLWRIWRHKNGHLYPLNYSQTPWKKNPEGFVESHALPALGSNQGFYGFYHLKEVPRQEGNVVRRARTGNKDSGFSYVIGSFLAFGRIVKAKKGCRVQYAKPEYLILPDQNEDFALELMTVAEEYGMKPITAEQARTLKGGLLKDQDWKRK